MKNWMILIAVAGLLAAGCASRSDQGGTYDYQNSTTGSGSMGGAGDDFGTRSGGTWNNNQGTGTQGTDSQGLGNQGGSTSPGGQNDPNNSLESGQTPDEETGNSDLDSNSP